jgi:hypothetical protein
VKVVEAVYLGSNRVVTYRPNLFARNAIYVLSNPV